MKKNKKERERMKGKEQERTRKVKKGEERWGVGICPFLQRSRVQMLGTCLFLFPLPKKREKFTTKSIFYRPEGSGDGVGAVYPAVQIEHLVGYVLCKQLKIIKVLCKQ